MDVAMVITFEQSIGTCPIYCHSRPCSLCDNIIILLWHVPADRLGSKSSPWKHASIHPNLVSLLFYTIPSIKLEDFSVTCTSNFLEDDEIAILPISIADLDGSF